MAIITLCVLLVCISSYLSFCSKYFKISGTGSVYSWGYNAEGALGLGSVVGHQHTPYSLTDNNNIWLNECEEEESEKAIDIKAGGWHSSILTSNFICYYPILFITNT